MFYLHLKRLILSFMLRSLKPSIHLAKVMNFISDLSLWPYIFFINSSRPSTSIPVARYTFSNSSLSSRLLIPNTSSCSFLLACNNFHILLFTYNNFHRWLFTKTVYIHCQVDINLPTKFHISLTLYRTNSIYFLPRIILFIHITVSTDKKLPTTASTCNYLTYNSFKSLLFPN